MNIKVIIGAILFVVIVVVGWYLSPILLNSQNPQKQLDQGKDVATQNLVMEIVSGAVRYKEINGKYPTSVQEIVAAGELKDVVLTPDVSSQYQYELMNNGQDCNVSAILSSGERAQKLCSENSTAAPR